MTGLGCGCRYTVCPHNFEGSARDPDAPRLPAVLDCQPGDPVRVVEHDDRTREPRPGGRVLAATVVEVTHAYIIVMYDGQSSRAGRDQFWRETGWRAWDGMFTWRLECGPVS